MKIESSHPRDQRIFNEDLAFIVHRTDRMFFWLLIAQWLFAIALALVWSPFTWIGQRWLPHEHVIAAVVLGFLFGVYPWYCILRRPGRPLTRHVVAVGQLLQSALLVHVTGGRIETHFHVFGSLALLAFYRDWRVLITATVVTFADHLALGFWFPLSVYGVEQATVWRSLEHAFWVIFEVIFLSISCGTGIRELSVIATRQAELEQAKDGLESRVAERTESLSKEVTERRQVQEALASQTRVLQSILDNMGEAVVVADMDAKFVLVNPAADRLVGIPHRSSDWREWPQKYGAFFPDRVTPFPAEHIPLLRAIRGDSCEDVEIFLRNPGRPDGIFVVCNAQPIRDERGILTGGVVVFHDLTERKLAEEALAERARLSGLTADVALALTRSDDSCTVLRCSCEAVVRHLDADFVRIWVLNDKEQVLELQASAGIDTHMNGAQSRVPLGQDLIGKIGQKREPHRTHELPADAHEGTGEWSRRDSVAAFAGYPLIVGERLHGVMATYSSKPFSPAVHNTLAGVADNVALGIERFEARQKLARANDEKIMAEAANRAKNQFLSRMSHELRTPLNAILGFGQILEMDELPAEQRECVEQINRGGKHLLGLINEVLDIARIEAGHMDISPEPVRVAEVFREALELVRPLGSGKNIRFRDDLDAAKNQSVVADIQKLKQVLLNLLANAIKYNRHQGEVGIWCDVSGPGRLRLGVSDTGQGIPPVKLGRLFTPFDRLGVEHGDTEGSGLGLALSKALVELMGGRLTVTSTVGQGSTFHVELVQAVSSQECMFPAPGISLSAPPATDARTVLYIEDNLDNLKLIQRVLAHRPGVGLLTAMQGSLGMDLAREHRPDLILLDVHLPDLTGDQVLRRLRSSPETQDIPVVVISADATTRQIENLHAAGANQYITKPINVPKFLEAVDVFLNKDYSQ